MKGKVFLVGAGPGDIELLTLKAVRALRQADVVLIDELVDREALQYAKRQARVIEVGKRGGCRSTPQQFIVREMVRFARRGWCVVRLKGGDPFVFGRGGEERAFLEAAGIEVEVVNGITAGIAAPAALGIPVTHRDLSRGVTLVTGHTHDGSEPDWEALARSGMTLVIYMGMSNLARIVERLRAAGLSGATPVAVVQNGTRADQRQLLTRLGEVVAEVARAGIGSPAIVVIGEVVNLAAARREVRQWPQVA